MTTMMGGSNDDCHHYCAGTKVFCKIASETHENLLENPKKSEIFENVQTLPNASQCFLLHPSGSEQIRMGPNMSENFEKLAKTSKKFAKTSKNIAKVVAKTFFTAQ